MAKPGKGRRAATTDSADEGFWERPALMNLVADLLFVFALLALAWAAWTAVKRLPVFPLREVVVAGDLQQVTAAQIEQATRVALTGNFFTVELDEVRATFEKLPWVRRADVRRRWPDGLDLSIEEHVAVARWRHADGESRLVNDRGEVFAAASQASLPSLSGPEGSAPQVLERYGEFVRTLARVSRKPAVVSLSSREAWQLKLDDGVVVELGRDEAKHTLAERLDRFVAHYRPALERTRLAKAAVVDMRYPNGFTLRPAQPEKS